MKRILLLLLALSFFSGGCIFYKKMTYHIRFNPGLNSGQIKITYYGLSSTEKSMDKRKDDFDELIGYLKNDDLLLDNLEYGIYIKNRNLYKKNGELVGEYSGIFRNPEIGNSPLQMKNDEILLILDSDDQSDVSCNGRVIKSDNTVILSWPKDQEELVITFTTKAKEPVFSFNQLFDEWSAQ